MIYPKEIIQRKRKPMCMKVFTITLFIMVKYWKKPNCSKQENALINYEIAIQWIKIDNWEKYEIPIKYL